jgi:hypothetical protein
MIWIFFFVELVEYSVTVPQRRLCSLPGHVTFMNRVHQVLIKVGSPDADTVSLRA